MKLLLSLVVCLCSNGCFSGVPPPDTVVNVNHFADPTPSYHFRLTDLPPIHATNSTFQDGQVVEVPVGANLTVPKGFKVNVFAQGLIVPRWFQLTPTGDILVAESNDNRIRLLRDSDGNGVADVISVFANHDDNNLFYPFGMAFDDDYFYVANMIDVRRYNYTFGSTQLGGHGEKLMDLPHGGHVTRNLLLNGTQMFVTCGSSENVVDEGPPRAAVTLVNKDGSDSHTFAFGLRNPNGLEFHPITKKLYTTVNERDELGDELVPDYFTQIQQDEFFGWPYVYLSPNNRDPRVNVTHPEWINRTKTPDVLFQSHSAALGMKFYDKTQFPAHYHNGAFVAFHGSWNRHEGTGYKIVFVPFNTTDNRPTGGYEDFMTGFLVNSSIPTTWGRPVGILVMPDGSLLVADDANGRIYRVYYDPDESTTVPPTSSLASSHSVSSQSASSTVSNPKTTTSMASALYPLSLALVFTILLASIF